MSRASRPRTPTESPAVNAATFDVGADYFDVRTQTRRIVVLNRTRDFLEIEEPAKHERRRVKIRVYETEDRFVGCFDTVEYLSIDDGLWNPTGRHVDTPF